MIRKCSLLAHACLFLIICPLGSRMMSPDGTSEVHGPNDAKIRSQYSPQVQLHPLQVNTLVDHLAVFDCRAVAQPMTLTYEWFIDERLIEGANRSRLIFSKLTKQVHNRTLECRAINSVGTGKGKLKLQVRHLSILDNDYYPVDDERSRVLVRSYRVGENINLRCHFDSYPSFGHAEWYKKQISLSSLNDVSTSEATDLVRKGTSYFKLAHFRVNGSASFEQFSDELQVELNEVDPQIRSGFIESLAGTNLYPQVAWIHESLDWRVHVGSLQDASQIEASCQARGNLHLVRPNLSVQSSRYQMRK